MTITKHFSIVRLGLVALMAAVLAGCGGGGGGGGTGSSSSSSSSSSGGGTGGINSSFQDAGASGVGSGSSILGVTVNSPPVVKFKVTDSNGNPVTTLTSSNVNLAMAQLIPEVPNTTSGGIVDGITPARWVPLITRTANSGAGDTEFGNDGTVKPYIQGYTDPKTCGITNLDTSQSSTGVYTYTFCTDVKTAQDVVNNAYTGTVVWDSNAVHRVAIQLSYTDPVTGKTVRTNPYVDFTVDGTGSGNQLKDSQGNPIVAARQVVDKASCNECHYKLIAHGSRVEPNYCVICHNPSSGDQHSGDVSTDLVGGISFPYMIHKFHMGEDLTNHYQVHRAVANDVRLPQDPRNCTKCHDNASDANHPTINGDNWMNNPNRNACGACHDTVNFDDGTNHPQPGGARPDDTQCKVCHTPSNIALYHQATVATPHNPTPIAGFPSLQYKILAASLVNPGVDNRVSVQFQILQGVTAAKDGTVSGGTPLALNAYAGDPTAPVITGFKACTPATKTWSGATFKVAYSTGQDGIPNPSDWNMPHDSLSLCDAWAGADGNNGANFSEVDATNHIYQVIMTNTSPSGSTASHPLSVPADAKMVTAVMSDGFVLTTLPSANGSGEFGGAVPGIPSLFTATGNTPDGEPNVGRRTVMNVNGCNSCHDRLGSHPWFHTGNYAADMGPTVDVSMAMCAICHTPNQGGSTGWSANTRIWVHGIHSANTGIRTVPFTWHGTSTTDNYYTNMTFPGVINNCAACHIVNSNGTTTYDFSDPQYTDALITSMLNVVANTGTKNPAASNAWIFPQQAPIGSGVWAYGISVDNLTNYGVGATFDKTTTAGIVSATDDANLVSSPITAACSSCHDDIQWTNHMKTMGGLFYDARGNGKVSGKQVYTESCLTCHGPGTDWNIKDVHAQSLPQ